MTIFRDLSSIKIAFLVVLTFSIVGCTKNALPVVKDTNCTGIKSFTALYIQDNKVYLWNSCTNTSVSVSDHAYTGDMPGRYDTLKWTTDNSFEYSYYISQNIKNRTLLGKYSGKIADTNIPDVQQAIELNPYIERSGSAPQYASVPEGWVDAYFGYKRFSGARTTLSVVKQTYPQLYQNLIKMLPQDPETGDVSMYSQDSTQGIFVWGYSSTKLIGHINSAYLLNFKTNQVRKLPYGVYYVWLDNENVAYKPCPVGTECLTTHDSTFNVLNLNTMQTDLLYDATSKRYVPFYTNPVTHFLYTYSKDSSELYSIWTYNYVTHQLFQLNPEIKLSGKFFAIKNRDGYIQNLASLINGDGLDKIYIIDYEQNKISLLYDLHQLPPSLKLNRPTEYRIPSQLAYIKPYLLYNNLLIDTTNNEYVSFPVGVHEMVFKK